MVSISFRQTLQCLYRLTERDESIKRRQNLPSFCNKGAATVPLVKLPFLSLQAVSDKMWGNSISFQASIDVHVMAIPIRQRIDGIGNGKHLYILHICVAKEDTLLSICELEPEFISLCSFLMVRSVYFC